MGVEVASWDSSWDVDIAGNRFLMLKSVGSFGSIQVQVVLNWIDELERLVPAP